MMQKSSFEFHLFSSIFGLLLGNLLDLQKGLFCVLKAPFFVKSNQKVSGCVC